MEILALHKAACVAEEKILNRRGRFILKKKKKVKSEDILLHAKSLH
jgi:hypothetical protein